MDRMDPRGNKNNNQKNEKRKDEEKNLIIQKEIRCFLGFHSPRFSPFVPILTSCSSYIAFVRVIYVCTFNSFLTYSSLLKRIYIIIKQRKDLFLWVMFHLGAHQCSHFLMAYQQHHHHLHSHRHIHISTSFIQFRPHTRYSEWCVSVGWARASAEGWTVRSNPPPVWSRRLWWLEVVKIVVKRSEISSKCQVK